MTGSERDDVKDLVSQHWNRRAETFDDEPQHGIHSEEQRECWLSVLREWVGAEPLETLDVGCGTGVVSLLLAELGHDVTGVDRAPEMLDRARLKARRENVSVEFLTGDAEALELPDDAYDVVVARHLLWTLPDPARAIGEWCRVAKPGGRLLLIEGDWNHDEPRGEYGDVHGDLPFYHGRPAKELAAFLRHHGLAEIQHESVNDPVLWGREPRHDYYVLEGTVPP